MAGKRLGAGHGGQLAAALMQLDSQAKEGLEAPAEAAARPAHPLGDRPYVPAVERVQAQDPVRLSVA